MSKRVNMVSVVPNRELKYGLVDSFQVTIDDDSLTIDHAIDFHDFNLEFKNGKRLVANDCLFELCRIMEQDFFIFGFLFLS